LESRTSEVNSRIDRADVQPVSKAIFIHGNGGSTAGDIWFPWLAAESEALGLEVVRRTFPDNVKARARFWLPFIEELGADEDTILIGHSSGAVAAMRHAETHQLLGSILVSPCFTDLGDSGEAESGYYSRPWDWPAIREHQQWIGVYHSADDPLVPVAEARFIARELRCSYFELEGRGHFIDQRTFPEIAAFLKRKLSSAAGGR
jgi:uncharacterized protein